MTFFYLLQLTRKSDVVPKEISTYISWSSRKPWRHGGNQIEDVCKPFYSYILVTQSKKIHYLQNWGSILPGPCPHMWKTWSLSCSMVGSERTRPSLGYPNHLMANTITFLVSLTRKVTWLTLQFSQNVGKMSEKIELVLQFWEYDKFDYIYWK